ncbi:MAG: aminotransferase class V-fold PLP-dependent enzyme [Rhodospirillaceae bacterium]|nr:aminotransferase class V-fold PLP-dependent enzyme [Rhodospirillaceae bacterium]MBT4688433.1 aminotransferase class V-fold PLP-dependent enzyme [Rhodospirillaceae bacterium]MBT5079736.1 aminotransferase class V-fold PLP-dependent enzyme [Rhodospirillaceae bacterium]MBT5526310.1 aminotransferase class V-fold PLP-dependent enzyme [Rhodospirillaceae bacterium]MBT5881550.1 aminotransferase class V-fold PLP-dependent enzyme [Rhodospirillaceae bacterium]
MRRLSHQMIDDAVDYTRGVRERPVWQAMPEAVRANFAGPMPTQPSPADDVYGLLMENMMPYPMGNIHPRFWMWYMGSSNFTGAMGDFLAAILGSNLGGGNHAAALIDQQVVDWLKQMVGFPKQASGTLVSGGSAANIVALTVARNEMAGSNVRENGIGGIEKPLRFYASDQVHGCHQIAVETLGLGNKALRRIPSLADCCMDIDALRSAIAEDRATGFKPACIIATAGTVNTGAIDDLRQLAALCRRENLWFHVDGCIGALLAIAPENKHRVMGMELADSIALDPHKWLHAPFEVGCALVRDAKAHIGAFSLTPEYLETAERGIAAAPWLFDYGVQTSRGFKALKVWMALQEHGVEKFGRLIDQNVAQAAYLTDLIEANPKLELASDTTINIVCYRYEPKNISAAALKHLNTEIMLQMQETGVAAVSDTTVHGKHCLRVAINNHRTVREDLDILVAETVRLGNSLMADGQIRLQG